MNDQKKKKVNTAPQGNRRVNADDKMDRDDFEEKVERAIRSEKAEKAELSAEKDKKISAKKREKLRKVESKRKAREEKLEEKKRKKALKLEEKNKKREATLERRRRQKAKRARLKNATPSEKKRMVAEIRAEKERRRKAKLEAKKTSRLEKDRIKAERRADKLEAKRMRRADRDNRDARRIFKSRRHVAMFSAVCSVFVVFSALLGFSAMRYRQQTARMTQQLNNVYERAFYDLVDNMNNLSVKLSKLMISTGKDSERYLVEVIRQSDATANNLSDIPVAEESIINTMKYVNQLGDFCLYLQKKLANGGELSESDVKNIETLYDTNMLLYNQMNNFYAKVMAGYKFTDNLSEDMIYKNPMSDAFNEIQNGSIEYPTLIYDGPFSDAVINADFKGFEGLTEVSKESANELLVEYLKPLSPDSIEYESETGAKMSTYNFNVKIKGESAYAQVSKMGGKLMLFDNSRVLDNFDVSVEECVERAESFVKNLGYENMKAVWSSDYNGYVYVNVVPEQDGVLIYPDMIKVKVGRDNGEILGFDAMTFYMNHTARDIEKPDLSALKVRQKISSKLQIESEKLVIIPLDGGKETLAYEFYGTYRDMLYFVFADADTGSEINVYRVIDSESGALVM